MGKIMTFSMLQMQSPLFAQQLSRSVNVMNQRGERQSVADPGRFDQPPSRVVKEWTPVMGSITNSTLQSRLNTLMHTSIHASIDASIHTSIHTTLLQIAEPDCNGAIICNSGN